MHHFLDYSDTENNKLISLRVDVPTPSPRVFRKGLGVGAATRKL